MITVDEIKAALTPIAPAAHSVYGGKATVYITFFMYNERDEAYAEDEPISEGTYWQFDVWRTKAASETPTMFDLKNQVKATLKKLDFQGFTAQDLYESDTGTDHMAIRCNYVD